MNNSTAKAKPKMTVKNGVVYGDALSAQEKKRIVMQKKKGRKAKKVRKSAQQTIPYRELVPTLEYVKQEQEKPSIRDQLKAAAKTQPEKKSPVKSKTHDMEL